MTENHAPAGPVVIAYDGSDDADRAIAAAASLVPGRPVVILSVWQGVYALPTAAWAPIGAYANIDEDLSGSAREMTDQGVAVAREHGLEATPDTAEARGPVWDAIVRRADELDAALIVMGSRGRGGLASVVLGSVSTGVSQHAHRPVLIVRHPERVAGEQ